MFEALIEVLGLPAPKVPSAVEMPDEADVPCHHHRAIGVPLYYEVLVRDLQLLENTPSRLVQLLSILLAEYQLLHEHLGDLHHQAVPREVLGL